MMFVCLIHEALSSTKHTHAVLHVQAGDSTGVQQSSCKTNTGVWKALHHERRATRSRSKTCPQGKTDRDTDLMYVTSTQTSQFERENQKRRRRNAKHILGTVVGGD